MAICLVTGGAGFIGSHLVELLLTKGHTVRVLDDFSTGKVENLANATGELSVIKGDICNKSTVNKASKSVDFIFHEAAVVSVSQSIKDPIKTTNININGSKNVLEAALENNAKKVIFASSAAVYGDTKPPLSEDLEGKPLSPYGKSKLEVELLLKQYHKSNGLKFVALRYFNVYGPRQSASSESGVIATFLDDFHKNKVPVVFGDGKQTRDFIYVRDVALANLRAMETSKADGEAINVATGKSIDLNQLVATLNTLYGKNIQPVYDGERVGDIKYSYADTKKAETLLGFSANTTLENGLKRTMKWRACF
ncbi:L-arabinose 1-dehydrogenase (NAD(P)(+)) [Candidatus Bilamarchaeum dharawalense]|uniref:L-arabinose 1-dehydrogenase (NAD(P)(+)) n=1 Tax=Candidatus Bilamarchaeum dharawalense TaxID=2885759 RepID=A0A5E4LQ20_9ARCH|nr:L-arabinose 1-dehydrogenase (NAD(P)(+)) [Candidatus Bilamarchaeum dharawalense]